MLVYAAITVAGAATGRAQQGAFPYFGSPISLPGTVNAQDYDDGGAGVSYYDTSGRTWERQALIKVRPVAGDLELGDRFLQSIEPFVENGAGLIYFREDFR